MTGIVIERLTSPDDLDGVLAVEQVSFHNPTTREWYQSELERPDVCYVFVIRTIEARVAGFCAFWRVADQIHINNLAMRPNSEFMPVPTTTARPCPAATAVPMKSMFARSPRVAVSVSNAAGSLSTASLSPVRAASTHLREVASRSRASCATTSCATQSDLRCP